MFNRVLMLGIPGVQTSRAAERLRQSLRAIGHRFDVWGFEKQYLWSDVEEKSRFLASPIEKQSELWLDSWKRFKKDLAKHKSSNCIVTMHGCFIGRHYGARCVFDPGLVARDFAPELVMTLITDIYDAWSITHAAAAGLRIKGDPALDELLIARRAEQIVGDQIALASSQMSRPHAKSRSTSVASRKRVRNLVLSAYHPVKTFVNAIASGDRCRVGYLSFPISQPRELQSRGCMSARRAVSKFVSAAFELQHRNPQLVVQCPLAIDELPFGRSISGMLENEKSNASIEAGRKALPFADSPHCPLDVTSMQQSLIEASVSPVAHGEDEYSLDYDRASSRWTLTELLNHEQPLVDPPRILERFSRKQCEQALGLIASDVTLRDFRLVEQADFLAVFNPILESSRDTMARSVREEISRALTCENLVFVFQDPTLDPSGIVWKQLQISPESRGTMESEPRTDYLIACDSEEQLLKHIGRGGALQ